MINTSYIVIFVLLLFSLKAKSQTNYIIYDLPETVTEKAKEYVNTYAIRNGKTNFIAELDKNADGNYLLFVIKDDFEKQESQNLLYKEVIKKTNRVVRLDSNILLPMITGEDLQFAYLGDAPPRKPNGKIGKKKVIFTHESYSITFDLTGKIYQ
ncbi:MAG TPA: hypothetical protein VIM65_04405 [Cyclobacteriaceae bacterium]